MNQKRRTTPIIIIILLSPVLFMGTILLSIFIGTKEIDLATIWEAFFHYDAGNVDHAIIMTARLPRALGAILVGAFLAISGALMQGMTRNYLASPSIMGVSDGSAFVITLCMVFAPGLSSSSLILFSMLGSALGAGIVFGFGSLLRNGLSPVRLAIIGTVIGTFLSSLSAAIASYFEVSQTISFWYNARLHQLSMDLFLLAIPFGVIGLVLALSVAKSITILSLGDEMSTNLGQRPAILKAITLLSVIFLTGTAIALVGKIGFVGLLIPHMTRYIVGIDYKWVIPSTGIIGGVFLGLSDVLSRLMNYPFETPIGVVTSLLGVPFFLYLIRTRGGKSHV
ncbi:iron ABC transporter permease [Pontibacillus sp. ALD_SL1]|uniref:FecCD family ABC transporter permease n=1 Tax=Pontibacillus sp. ALD_SL1 TaxID=2777185 RepID=UPI001A968BDA|nr:iron ABC transporter permease [Pontibacillus sp. ALD_SL1]QST01038.1 iron ABC transporter permease [Pontibacillus sp. ALD_SL1]